MASSTLQKIVAELAKLTASERLAVAAAAKHLTPNGADGEAYAQDDEDLFIFYTKLRQTLADKGIKSPNWNGARKTKSFKVLPDKFAELQAYTNEHFGALDRRNRQRLYGIYARVIVAWVEENPYTPLTTRIAINHVDKISEIMANAFPGYAESKLLPIILGIEEGQ